MSGRRLNMPACLLLCAVVSAPPAPAQEVTARAWVDSTSYLIGDWITVHVELKHPARVQFRPMVGDTLNGFHIVERGALEPVRETQTTTHFIVAKYDSGSAVLPPLPFFYSLPGDTASRTAVTNPLPLTIRTVSVDTSKDIKDVKPPLFISMTLAEIALFAGLLLLIGGAVYLYMRYRKRRPQETSGTVEVPPSRPAHLIALEELGMLKEKKLWQQGLMKQYYSEVTEIVRRYFENRFAFMALEQTTDEIVGALRRHPGAAAVQEETERALRLADLVKFAKYQPVLQDHEEMMKSAYDIVEKTKVVPVVSQQPMEQEAVAHAGT